MVKIRFTEKGMSQVSGDGVEIASAVAPSFGMMPFGVSAVQALTSDTVLVAAQAGVLTVSSSTGGAKTLTMPNAADVPGSVWTIRSLSADAHLLTASSAQAGVEVFASFGSGGDGHRLALPAVIGSSVSLVSDGIHYLVLGASGTMTISVP